MKRFLSMLDGCRWLICVFAVTLTATSYVRGEDTSVTISETKEHRDARMAWWREARFGMFIHWGLYSVPAGIWKAQPVNERGEWIMNAGKIPVADYKALAAQFNPVKFDAEAWVSLAQQAGMKYIVITSKHHDGFAMFKSEANPFNIVDATPFKRDPLKELAAACQRHGIKFGFYYSQDQDWTAPGGASLENPHWDKAAQDGDFATYLHTKAIPQMKELLTNYQPSPAVIWFDTPTAEMTPELAGEILALLKQHPGIIWNNRLGGGNPGDTATPEELIPVNGLKGDWETCMTINDTWGYKSNDTKFKSGDELTRNLIDIASKGGNYLLNVGPTAEEIIPGPEVDRLQKMGAWLKVNGEAIYGTQASPFKEEQPWGRATQKPGRLYLSVFDWPKDETLLVPIANSGVHAYLLAQPGEKLPVQSTPRGVRIKLPAHAPDPVASVIVLRIEGASEPIDTEVKSAADGSLLFKAEDANLKGDTIKFEGNEGRKNVGYWDNLSDRIEWTARIDQPGDFDVMVDYALDPGSQGAAVVLVADKQKLDFTPPVTANWNDYKSVSAGRLKVEKKGRVDLALLAKQKPGQGILNLRSITLVPAKP